MPFTFAHPAIILPFHYCSKKYVSLTGLIAGSVVPDFEYFLRMRVKSAYSHTSAGMLWFDIPLAILLAFIFHNVVRNRLIDHLPRMLQQRLIPYSSFSWNARFRKTWLICFLSVIIGAGSHLFWDSFTHEQGFFVTHIPVLRTMYGPIPLYKIIQHGSSVLGLVVIVCATGQLPVIATGRSGTNQMLYWLPIAMLTTIFITLRITMMAGGFIFGNIVVSLISSFLAAVTMVSFAGLKIPRRL